MTDGCIPTNPVAIESEPNVLDILGLALGQ